MRSKNSTIQVRASDEEKSVIQLAAELMGENVSEYMLESALMRLSEFKPKIDRSRGKLFYDALQQVTQALPPAQIPQGVRERIQKYEKARAAETARHISGAKARAKMMAALEEENRKLKRK